MFIPQASPLLEFQPRKQSCHVTHKGVNPSPSSLLLPLGSTVLQVSGSQMGVSNSSFGSIHFLNERQCPMVVKDSTSVTLSPALKAQ